MDYKDNLNNFINENIDQNKLQERLFNSDDDMKIQEKFFNKDIKEKNQYSLYNFYDRKKDQITEKNDELYNTIKIDPENNVNNKYEQKFKVFTDMSSYWISKEDYENFKQILGDKELFKKIIVFCEIWYDDVYVPEEFIEYVTNNTFLPKYVPEFILVKTLRKHYYPDNDSKKVTYDNDITRESKKYLFDLENNLEKEQKIDIDDPYFVSYPPIFDECEDKENGRSR